MKSQNKKVKEHLESGQAISTWTAIRKWHITRLASRICDLREQGMEIYGKMIENHGKRYKVYYLKNSPHFESWGKSY